MAAKTLKEFDSLHRRDFDNGAVLDEIRGVYKQRDDLLAALDSVEWVFSRDGSYCPWCGNNKTYGHDAKCPRQAAIAGARGGGQLRRRSHPTW